MSELNHYTLSRNFWDFAFDNPEKISPNHCAIYYFAIEHCNRLGWKEKFGFPSQMTMDAVGIKKHSTYKRYFDDLVEWGFFDLIQQSKNQYSANIIRLMSAIPKKGEALGKAIAKHGAKQTASMGQSNGLGNGESKRSINKPLNNEPTTLKQGNESFEKVFLEYKKMRGKIRKPLTERAEELVRSKLKKMSSDEKTQILILEQSILNCWQDVFPLKETKNGTKPKVLTSEGFELPTMNPKILEAFKSKS